jgi:hypothetical protein
MTLRFPLAGCGSHTARCAFPTLRNLPVSQTLRRRGACAWRIANSRSFLGFSRRREQRGEFDRNGGDHRDSVPFSCRLEDATSSNKQQLEATRGNSQRLEAKAFKQQEATSSNSQQLPATRSNSPGTTLLAGGLLVRIQPEEPFFTTNLQ